jgi:hypothetical protein
MKAEQGNYVQYSCGGTVLQGYYVVDRDIQDRKVNNAGDCASCPPGASVSSCITAVHLGDGKNHAKSFCGGQHCGEIPRNLAHSNAYCVG